MKWLPVLAVALACMQPAELAFCEDQPSSPTPAYVVQVPGLRVAEMSPDEKYLAAFIVRAEKEQTAVAQVQLWDFRTGTLGRGHSLPVPASPSRYRASTAYIRYTSDSQLLAVYDGAGLIHVLSTNDLSQLRTIQIQNQANINAFEVSPTAHRVAARMSGEVRVYDLDSGEELRTWRIQQFPEFKPSVLLRVTPQLEGNGLAWQEDGSVLAISVADGPPCLRGDGTIYILDLASEKPVKTFRVPLLSAKVGFGTGNSLYVASDTCGGYFSHWVLDLPIFDSTTGREIGKLPAGKVGVRNYITISTNRRFLLAYADREKTTFTGLEDTLETENAQWQVWDLADRKVALILPAAVGSPSLSSTGRFVYANRAQQVSIFSVPAPPGRD